MASSLENKT